MVAVGAYGLEAFGNGAGGTPPDNGVATLCCGGGA